MAWVLDHLQACLCAPSVPDAGEETIIVSTRALLLRVLTQAVHQQTALFQENLECLFVTLSRLPPAALTADLSATFCDIFNSSSEEAHRYMQAVGGHQVVLSLLRSPDECVRAHAISLLASHLRWCDPHERARLLVSEDLLSGIGQRLAAHRPALGPSVRDALWGLVARPSAAGLSVDLPQGLAVFFYVLLRDKGLAAGRARPLADVGAGFECYFSAAVSEVLDFLKSLLAMARAQAPDSPLYAPPYAWLPGLVAILCLRPGALLIDSTVFEAMHDLALNVIIHLFLSSSPSPSTYSQGPSDSPLSRALGVMMAMLPSAQAQDNLSLLASDKFLTFKAAFFELYCCLCAVGAAMVDRLADSAAAAAAIFLLTDHVLIACGFPWFLNSNVNTLIQSTLVNPPPPLGDEPRPRSGSQPPASRFLPSPLLGAIADSVVDGLDRGAAPLLQALDQSLAVLLVVLTHTPNLSDLDHRLAAPSGGCARQWVRLAVFRLVCPCLAQLDSPTKTLQPLSGPALQLLLHLLQRSDHPTSTAPLIFASAAALAVRVYKCSLLQPRDSEVCEVMLGQLAELLRACVCGSGASDLLGAFVGADGLPLLPRFLPLAHTAAAVPCAMHLSSMQWLFALGSHGAAAVSAGVDEGLSMAAHQASAIISLCVYASPKTERTVSSEAQAGSVCKINSIASQRRSTADAALSRQRALAARSWQAVLGSVVNARGVWAHLPRSCSWTLDMTEDLHRRRLRLLAVYDTLGLDLALGRTASERDESADSVERVSSTVSLSTQILLSPVSAARHVRREALDGSAHPDDALLTVCSVITIEGIVRCTFKLNRATLYLIVDETAPAFVQASDDERAEMDAVNMSLGPADLVLALPRRYIMQRTAVELFLTNHRTVLIDFPSTALASTALRLLVPLLLGSDDSACYGLRPLLAQTQDPVQLFHNCTMTRRWQQREVSNFHYLMYLNTLAGRSYHDLGQYPVFPWVLQQYAQPTLDLNDPHNYRNLQLPVGSLNPSRREAVVERYQGWEDDNTPAFHHGTHYSTPGYVLFWLTRLMPFTRLLHKLQGGAFDHASRAFTSISQAWDATVSLASDVKELIPEHYYQPASLSVDCCWLSCHIVNQTVVGCLVKSSIRLLLAAQSCRQSKCIAPADLL